MIKKKEYFVCEKDEKEYIWGNMREKKEMIGNKRKIYLLYGNRLGEISREININTLQDSKMVRK